MDNRQNAISWQRDIPVRHTVDVFVAGGGPAGLAAAATAARQGRTVFLAEALNCLGGMATSGAPFEKGDAGGNMQPGTLCTLWADVDWERAKAAGNGMWQQSGKLAQAIADGIFSQSELHMPGMLPMGPHTGIGNIGHCFGLDGTDERSLTAALIRSRRMVLEYERYYKRYLTGYERAELVATAALIGVRESRRILGDYVLSATDYGGRAVFTDEIGRYNYWVDVHPAKPTEEEFRKHSEYVQMVPLREGESYGIPYRALTPRGLRNVLVAGRCISADRVVQASIRVMPGCFITGQAAGLAAALAAEGDGDVRAIAERCRLAHVTAGNAAAVGEFLRAAFGVGQAEIVVDATGLTPAIVEALPLCAPSGQFILLGSPRAAHEGNLTALLSDIHLRNISLRGALEWNVPVAQPAGMWGAAQAPVMSLARKQRMVFDWMLRGEMLLAPLVSHRLPAALARDAYEGLLQQPEQFTGVALDWRG